MKKWLIFVQSYEEFQKVNSFLRSSPSVDSIIYFVINGPIKCEDDRIIGQENEILLALSFSTYENGPIREVIEKEIVKNLDSIIRIDDLDQNEVVGEEDFEAECYIKKGKSFLIERELYKYLAKIKFF